MHKNHHKNLKKNQIKRNRLFKSQSWEGYMSWNLLAEFSCCCSFLTWSCSLNLVFHWVSRKPCSDTWSSCLSDTSRLLLEVQVARTRRQLYNHKAGHLAIRTMIPSHEWQDYRTKYNACNARRLKCNSVDGNVIATSQKPSTYLQYCRVGREQKDWRPWGHFH